MTWDRSVVFGDFRLARAEQRLYRAGEEVRIDPKAWELLCYLVDHSGQLLTKATLFDELWKDVVVSDAALSQTILRLRSALGDSARQPRYIETLHRRGIRFIADIQSCSVGPSRPAGGEVRGVTDLAELSSPVSDAIFVGRERELERLAGALVCAERGQRQLVMVSGELGIGKTAILDRFVESLPTDWAVARGQCIEPHDSPEAYLPVFSAVEQLAQSDRRDAVIAVLRRCAPTWLAQMPWLVDTDEARALREQVSAGSRARMLREMVAALSALAGERGLLLVLEDLHWSDPATLDLLALLAHRGESARLIVAGNFRPAYALAHGHPIVELVRTLESKELCVAVRLEPLPLAGVREFVARRFPQGPLPDGFAEELLERTDGNPLFLKTIADHMVETGAMRRSDRGWELAGGIDFADAAIIPAGLRQMIEAVLRRIDAADLPLLDAASVAGTTFASAAVASGLDPGEASLELVESCCQRLINKWHVLQPASEQRWPDGTRTARYRFRHGLYRTVLYERLAPSVRRRL
ncbi:MAG TPA: AAA family ATPase, partial [Terriglobales bacterium]|nr:AAA family ATPase [Terriglobales bacterium]